MRKWFLFEHTIDALRDGKPQRGVIATHLCDAPSAPPAIPLCDVDDATHIPDATAHVAFVLACTECLAISEGAL